MLIDLERLDAMQNLNASSPFIFSTKVLFNFPVGKSRFPETSQAYQIHFFFVDDILLGGREFVE